MNNDLSRILEATPVLPVVTIEQAEWALPLADALLRGGIGTIEITLRTPAALPAIEQLARSRSELRIGAGTCVSPADLANARSAGAAFSVSPGSTQALIEAACATSFPWLPGAATPSEIMRLNDAGFTLQKFFPAGATGGVALLRAIAPVFPATHFCPTGGITAKNAADYLALPNVRCVGGSWLTPSALIRARDWQAITALAAAATSLRGTG